MLFTAQVLIAGGVTIAVAAIDKTLSNYGYHAFGEIVRIALPIAAMLTGVYFLEHNPILGWLK